MNFYATFDEGDTYISCVIKDTVGDIVGARARKEVVL